MKTNVIIVIEEDDVKVLEHGLQVALSGARITHFFRVMPNSPMKEKLNFLIGKEIERSGAT